MPIIQPTRVLLQVAVSDPNGDAITTGDGKAYAVIPLFLNGFRLFKVEANVTTVSSSGAVTVQLHNVQLAVDLLSTALTIDANETDSATAATPAVINPNNAQAFTGNQIRVDIDGAGTGAKGLTVTLTYTT